jgi:hypothetical protein
MPEARIDMDLSKATSISLTIPESLLLRADELIE